MRTLVKDTTAQQSISQEGNPNTLNCANWGSAGGAALPLHVPWEFVSWWLRREYRVGTGVALVLGAKSITAA